MKALIGVFASVAMVGAASAQISNLSVTPVDNAGGAAVLPAGTVTTDLAIDFTGVYTGSQHELILTSGSIVDLAPLSIGPSSVAPPFGNALFVWDTFIAQGGTSLEATQGAVGVGGGPVNIDGAKTGRVINATTWEVATNPAGGDDIIGGANFLVARFNLSADANGTYRYLGSANAVAAIGDADPSDNFFTSGLIQIENGVFVPEPASLALLSLGGLAMLRRRSA